MTQKIILAIGMLTGIVPALAVIAAVARVRRPAPQRWRAKRSVAAALSVTLALCAATPAWASSIELRPIRHYFETKDRNTDLEQHFVSSEIGAERLHIQNPKQWQAFLRRFSIVNPPAIDFRQHDVLVALMGVKGHGGGYSIHIMAANASSPGTRVTVLNCIPPHDGTYPAVMTAPYDMQLAPKLATPVEWQTVESDSQDSLCTSAKPSTDQFQFQLRPTLQRK